MKNYYTIAFYNLENLFDTKNDPKTLDDDYTPDSEMHWTKDRLNTKVRKLGQAISQIGYEEYGHPPLLLGVAEVENETALKTLVDSSFLKSKNYGYAHFDSPDERGIDNALLYRKDYFTLLHKEAITLLVNNEEGVRDFTRDILYVKGKIENEIIHILVNHWPSRRDGGEKTSYKRVAAALKNREKISEILKSEPNAKIIAMGDLNDDPQSESSKTLTGTDFYNPMEQLLTADSGSLNHKHAWNLFDQIIISNNFLQQHDNNFQFEEAKIFNPKNLQEYEGDFKGNPFRTYAGPHYLGGASDHFPVYTIFSIKN